MNQPKLLLVAALFLVSCSTPKSQSQNSALPRTTSPPPDALTPDTTITEPSEPPVKTTSNKASAKGWEISIKNVPAGKQTYQGKLTTHEAAGVWTVVAVTLKNTSTERQREENAPFNPMFSDLVDANANEYSITAVEPQYPYNLINKPFNPGEARIEYWLFDTPKGVKADQLVLGKLTLEKPVYLKLAN